MRGYLSGTRVFLSAGKSAPDANAACVKAVEDGLDPTPRSADDTRAPWFGSPEAAHDALVKIVDALNKITRVRPATSAKDAAPLIQSPEKVPLPGVADQWTGPIKRLNY